MSVWVSSCCGLTIASVPLVPASVATPHTPVSVLMLILQSVSRSPAAMHLPLVTIAVRSSRVRPGSPLHCAGPLSVGPPSATEPPAPPTLPPAPPTAPPAPPVDELPSGFPPTTSSSSLQDARPTARHRLRVATSLFMEISSGAGQIGDASGAPGPRNV